MSPSDNANATGLPFRRVPESLNHLTVSAVTFDLDGLLLNTEDIFEISGNVLMERRGREMTDDCRHQMLGRRPLEAFAILVETYQLEEPIGDLILETKEIFNSLIDAHLATMPGALEILDLVDSIAHPKALATSSPRRYMTDLLSRFGLEQHFPISLTAEDVTHGKPHPEIYLTAAERMNVPASEMVVFEDSEIGTRAAVAAGCIVVSVPNRHTGRQNFEAATIVADTLHDPVIPELLGRRG